MLKLILSEPKTIGGLTFSTESVNLDDNLLSENRRGYMFKILHHKW
jgi:hypothetical protein